MAAAARVFESPGSGNTSLLAPLPPVLQHFCPGSWNSSGRAHTHTHLPTSGHVPWSISSSNISHPSTFLSFSPHLYSMIHAWHKKWYLCISFTCERCLHNTIKRVSRDWSALSINSDLTSTDKPLLAACCQKYRTGKGVLSFPPLQPLSFPVSPIKQSGSGGRTALYQSQFALRYTVSCHLAFVYKWCCKNNKITQNQILYWKERNC